jgi:hypothetical protein
LGRFCIGFETVECYIERNHLFEKEFDMSPKFTRLVFALMLALSALGVSASAALADPPDNYDFTDAGSVVITDFCSFPITMDYIIKFSVIEFYNKEGVRIRGEGNVLEQDTFTANGKTLVGVPYRYTVRIFWDSSGNVTKRVLVGVIEAVPLPGGGFYKPAGQAVTPGLAFTLAPQKGNPSDFAGFCAALAP